MKNNLSLLASSYLFFARLARESGVWGILGSHFNLIALRYRSRLANRVRG